MLIDCGGAALPQIGIGGGGGGDDAQALPSLPPPLPL